jgi:hypothetical protein
MGCTVWYAPSGEITRSSKNNHYKWTYLLHIREASGYRDAVWHLYRGSNYTRFLDFKHLGEIDFIPTIGYISSEYVSGVYMPGTLE